MSLRKTVTIPISLYTSPSSSINISNIAFIPDEVILRTVTTMNDHRNNCSFQLWTDLIPGGGILYSQMLPASSGAGVITTSNQNYESHFTLKTQIQGSYTFTAFYVTNNTIPISTVGATTVFQLEFVKY